MEIRFFKAAEFRRCTPRCAIDDMNPEFLRKLDSARELARTPFKLNSAFRSKEYELSKGRSGTSSHTKGVAVDIYCRSSRLRMRIVSSLVSVGFRRIGVYPTFIHVDDDDAKVAALWLTDNDHLLDY